MRLARGPRHPPRAAARPPALRRGRPAGTESPGLAAPPPVEVLHRGRRHDCRTPSLALDCRRTRTRTRRHPGRLASGDLDGAREGWEGVASDDDSTLIASLSALHPAIPVQAPRPERPPSKQELEPVTIQRELGYLRVSRTRLPLSAAPTSSEGRVREGGHSACACACRGGGGMHVGVCRRALACDS
jgi:hypothetical protein